MTAVISDWYQRRVNPLLFSAHIHLSKYNCQPGVVRSIPNVSFSGRKRGTVDDELFVGGIVNRGRFQRLNIGPVTNLGHCETTHQLARGCIDQVFAVMRFGAQAVNASGEQAKLYPELNHEAEVVKSERLARSHELCRILFTANIFRHEDSSDASIGEALCPNQNLLPKGMVVWALKIPKF